MKLIIESGATKSDWTLLLNDGEISSFKMAGLNFSSGNDEFLARTLEEASLQVVQSLGASAQSHTQIDEIHFYAAGLFPSDDPESPFQRLAKMLGKHFPGADVHLESDLMAAARALFGHEPGIVCILGTGSNVCIYDGTAITSRVNSGGFILGDEGSASALGRAFISDYLKGLVPEIVGKYFESRHDMSYPEIVRNVYKGTSPSAYLGAFAKDILSFYATEHYMQNLVDENFRLFFARCLSRFKAENLPVGVAGSFGYACREIITALGEQDGFRFDRFVPSPSEGLIAYHR